MDFYEIRIFPISKTIERQYVQNMGLIWLVMCHIKTISNPYMGHRLSHIRPIHGPYMSHITQFGKGGSTPRSLYSAHTVFSRLNAGPRINAGFKYTPGLQG